MGRDGTDRATANNEMLHVFRLAWEREGIWYRFARDVKRAKGATAKSGSEAEDEPVWIGLLARAFKFIQELIEMALLKVTFRDVRIQ
jgi:hypothetical protein